MLVDMFLTSAAPGHGLGHGHESGSSSNAIPVPSPLDARGAPPFMSPSQLSAPPSATVAGNVDTVLDELRTETAALRLAQAHITSLLHTQSAQVGALTRAVQRLSRRNGDGSRFRCETDAELLADLQRWDHAEPRQNFEHAASAQPAPLMEAPQMQRASPAVGTSVIGSSHAPESTWTLLSVKPLPLPRSPTSRPVSPNEDRTLTPRGPESLVSMPLPGDQPEGRTPIDGGADPPFWQVAQLSDYSPPSMRRTNTLWLDLFTHGGERHNVTRQRASPDSPSSVALDARFQASIPHAFSTPVMSHQTSGRRNIVPWPMTCRPPMPYHTPAVGLIPSAVEERTEVKMPRRRRKGHTYDYRPRILSTHTSPVPST